MVKVFFDADVLFSVCYSSNPLSGTKKILFQTRLDRYLLTTSRLVIEEAKKNLLLIKPTHLIILKEILDDFNFKIIEILDEKKMDFYKDVVNKDDTHVIVGAIQARADYLLTFNKKHFLTDRFSKLHLPLHIVNPKDFIRQVIFDER